MSPEEVATPKKVRKARTPSESLVLKKDFLAWAVKNGNGATVTTIRDLVTQFKVAGKLGDKKPAELRKLLEQKQAEAAALERMLKASEPPDAQ